MKPASQPLPHCPTIIGTLLRTSHALASVQIDAERFCCLVSDDEWQAIIDYAGRFQERVRPDVGIESMRFAGIEVIKRSAVMKRGSQP